MRRMKYGLESVMMVASLHSALLPDSFMHSDVTAPPPPYSPLNNISWRQSSADILSALRVALQRAIGFSAGVGQKSRDVQDRFGVGFQLSWEIYSIVAEGNVLNCAPNVPTPASMKRLYGAMRKVGIQEFDVRAVEDAYSSFLAHVEKCAGDRDTFNVMMARLLGGDTARQNELVHREASFEANRYVLGIEERLQLLSYMIHPSAQGKDHYDIVRLFKRCGLIRYNLGQPLKLEIWVPSKRADGGADRQPLDASAVEQYGVPILPAFCSNPALSLRKRADGEFKVVEWEPEQIGPRGAIDFAFGSVERNTPFNLGPEPSGFDFPTLSRAVVRKMVFDFFVHRPTYGPMEYSASRYGSAYEVPADIANSRLIQLPSHEQIEFMGGGASAAHFADVPDYVNMLEYACSEMKWKLQEFDLYRLKVDYPMMDTLILRSFRFPATFERQLTSSR